MEVIPLALAPSLLWLWWFWKQEPKGRRESAHPLARAFVFGGLSTIPAGIVAGILEMFIGGEGNVWRYFLVVGPVEELFKCSAMRLAIRKEPTFNEHSDGIVFAAAAALGFAFVENICYFATVSPITIAIRCVLSVPIHVLDAVFWGEAIGRIRFVPGTSRSILINGLVLAALCHGLFDSLAISGSKYLPWYVLIVLLAGLYIFQWRQYGALMKRALFFQHPELVSLVPAVESVTEPAVEPAAEPAPNLVNAPSSSSSADNKDAAWDWTYVAKTVCFTFPTLVPIAIACAHTKSVGDTTFLLAMSVIVSIAFMMGVWSPGCTIREVALGTAMIGAIAGAISWSQSIASALTLGILGAFGAWLGEAMQNHSRRCPSQTHSHQEKV